MTSHPNQRSVNGFTLVEIVISMTILALISGTVMAILVQAGDTAADIRDMDQKDEEISRFLELLERTIETLPIDASIEMIPAADSLSGFPEMKISNAVGAFTFGEDIGSAGELTIGLQPQNDNEANDQIFELAISRDSFAPEDTDGDGMVIGAGGEDFLTPDEQGRYWLPLVSNITSATWRYWDEDAREWLTEWEQDTLPPIMEFVIEDSHRPGPVRAVFEIPKHLVTGSGTEPATTPTTTPTQTTSVTPNQPAGAGANPSQTSGASSVSRPPRNRRPGGRDTPRDPANLNSRPDRPPDNPTPP